ncbi:MAG TPA: GNAT family N-acetyltransferase [Candidatus Limnocylindria bacterium]|nr:GNAT family N-acetyltransferase [Candidatus Limnocylindria bacterium]
MTPSVRPVRPSDVDDIDAMIRELATYERSLDEVKGTADDLRRALCAQQPMLFGHVAEAPDGSLVGFALWYVTYSTWEGKHGIYLEDLFIRPQHRGTGLGKALLAALAAEATSRGYPRVEWWVLDWNEPAVEFYRSLGAFGMDEWTVYRLTGDALTELAATSR